MIEHARIRQSLIKASRLAGWRLSRSVSWKVARVFALLVSGVLTLAVVVLGVHGRTEGVHEVLTRACVLVAWLSVPFVAWWSAADRQEADRNEGILALARIHGIDARALAWGRGVAASVRLGLLVLASTTPVLVAVTMCAPTPMSALRSLLSAAPLVGFALGAGLAGGGLAALCGTIAPKRGRTLWLAVVVAPWLLDGVIAGARAGVSSVPGMLGLLAELAGSTGGWS